MYGSTQNDTLKRSFTSFLCKHYVRVIMADVTGYCVKCRAKSVMKNPQSVTLKNGKPATKGECSKCSTKMFRIGKVQ